MIRRVIVSFSPSNQPWITRQSYRYELLNALTFPMALAMIESSVVGVLATKAFQVPPYLFAVIMAAPMFANLTSAVWAHLARGRPKVRVINALQIASLAVVAAVALLPTNALGAVLLPVLVVVCRCLLAGVVTLRSTVWRMNYPRHARAQITGRLTVIQSLIGALAPLAGYALMDLHADAFRVLYPASVAIATIGVANFSRIRLRGERELLAYERQPGVQPQPHGAPAPIYEYDPKSSPPPASASDTALPSAAATTPTTSEMSAGAAAAVSGGSFWTVLRQDPTFRRYMLWQFFAGMANMMGEVVIILTIAELTRGIPSEYFITICLTTALPMLFAVVTLPGWARYLDRVHVVEFRTRQGWYWIGNQATQWLGLWLLFTSAASSAWIAVGWAVIACSRLTQGISRGGGMLAWNLGHNDFADRRMVATYMGIHVTLTGVRGAFGPFLAVALYSGWNPIPLPGVDVALPGFDGIGYHLFAVTTVLAIIAERGFRSLKRTIDRKEATDLPD